MNLSRFGLLKDREGKIVSHGTVEKVEITRVTTEFVKNCTLSFFVETQRPVLPFPNPPSLPP